jgi:hypothetical protein
MDWLFVETLSIETALSPDAAHRKLADATDTGWIGLESLKRDRRKIFVGAMDGNTFTIERILLFRNSFRPIVRGTIVASSRGASVQMQLTPSAGSLLFVVIFVGLSLWMSSWAMALLMISDERIKALGSVLKPADPP